MTHSQFRMQLLTVLLTGLLILGRCIPSRQDTAVTPTAIVVTILVTQTTVPPTAIQVQTVIQKILNNATQVSESLATVFANSSTKSLARIRKERLSLALFIISLSFLIIGILCLLQHYQQWPFPTATDLINKKRKSLNNHRVADYRAYINSLSKDKMNLMERGETTTTTTSSLTTSSSWKATAVSSDKLSDQSILKRKASLPVETSRLATNSSVLNGERSQIAGPSCIDTAATSQSAVSKLSNCDSLSNAPSVSKESALKCADRSDSVVTEPTASVSDAGRSVERFFSIESPEE